VILLGIKTVVRTYQSILNDHVTERISMPVHYLGTVDFNNKYI